MATTTNYGWTTPDNTDLVKDGAAAIRTLGSAIDTSMNTALGTKKAGLVLLNTTSFSGVTSQSINDVFSATYDTYRVVINWTSATAQNLGMRLRVAGADNSTAGNYMWGENGLTFSGGSSSNSNSSDTSWNMEYTDTNGAVMSMDIYDPFSSTKITRFTGLTVTRLSTAAASFYRGHGGNMTVTTSYTGFTLINAANITGTVSVYGYNK